VENVARMGEIRNAYKILVGISEGKRPFERSTCRWKEKVRIDIRETELEIMDWMHQDQGNE